MKKLDWINIWKLLAFSFLLQASFASGQEAKLSTVQPHTNYEFHYEDIENFRKVLETVATKGDTLGAIQTYFSNASEGMSAWIDRYNVTPELIKKAITFFPEYYQYLSTLEAKLRSFETQIAAGLDGLKKLYPSSFVYLPPIYYFILFSGGGSVEMTANMISIDYFGYHSNINEKEFDRIGGLFPKGKFPLVNVDLVPQVAIHETAHLLQAYIQGEIDYASIYQNNKQTMQAYAIREGGADFLTFLASGLIDENKYAFGDLHEKELWLEFEPLLQDNVDDHPGWFSGKSAQHPDWPWQIGYYMGFKMVEYYYHNSGDQEAALMLILNSHQEEDFQKFITKYREKWD